MFLASLSPFLSVFLHLFCGHNRNKSSPRQTSKHEFESANSEADSYNYERLLLSSNAADEKFSMDKNERFTKMFHLMEDLNARKREIDHLKDRNQRLVREKESTEKEFWQYKVIPHRFSYFLILAFVGIVFL